MVASCPTRSALIHNHHGRRMGTVVEHRAGSAARTVLPIARFNSGVMVLVEHVHIHATGAQGNRGRCFLVISRGLFSNREGGFGGTITGRGVIDRGSMKGLDEKNINKK